MLMQHTPLRQFRQVERRNNSNFGTVEDAEKKVGIQAGICYSMAGLQQGAYFQTGLFRKGCRLGEGVVMGTGRMRKKGNPVFLLEVSCCWRDAVGKD